MIYWLKRLNNDICFVFYTKYHQIRYQVSGEIDFKNLVSEDKIKDATKKRELTKALKAAFEEKYQNLPVSKGGDKASHLKFFFKRLRF